MSTEITVMHKVGPAERKIAFTQFSGGKEKGICIQLTQGIANMVNDPNEPGFIQLTRDDAYNAIAILKDWLAKTSGGRE